MWPAPLPSQRHDIVFGSPCRDIKVIAHRRSIHDQRVVTRRGDRIRNSPKDSRTIVVNVGSLAMHGAIVPADSHAVHLRDDLMSKAHSEHWDFARCLPHQILADSSLGRRTWAGREHDMARVHRKQRINGLLVVPHNPNLQIRIDHTDAVNEVPCKRVVVVDEKQHAGKVAGRAKLRRGSRPSNSVLRHNKQVFRDRIRKSLIISINSALNPL